MRILFILNAPFSCMPINLGYQEVSVNLTAFQNCQSFEKKDQELQSLRALNRKRKTERNQTAKTITFLQFL